MDTLGSVYREHQDGGDVNLAVGALGVSLPDGNGAFSDFCGQSEFAEFLSRQQKMQHFNTC